MPQPPRVLSGPAQRPGVSLELISLLVAMGYGAAIGALIASAVWWWFT
jgi:hypothetical protein